MFQMQNLNFETKSFPNKRSAQSVKEEKTRVAAEVQIRVINIKKQISGTNLTIKELVSTFAVRKYYIIVTHCRQVFCFVFPLNKRGNPIPEVC